ncbi:MAG: hypothetical protein AABZ65_03740 [Candidatus Omnitrophota bacterium]
MKKGIGLRIKIIIFILLFILSIFLQSRYRYIEISNVVRDKKCNVSFTVRNTTRKKLIVGLLISINRLPTKFHSGGSRGSKQIELTLLPQDKRNIKESLACSGLVTGGVADILVTRIKEINK